MKHFLNVQNGPVFALFLCIFTNFFLVLLIKKDFLRLLLCIFPNRQKKMQEADQTLWAACEQRHACNLRTAYTDKHFSQQKAVFLQLPTSSHLASLQSPTSSGRQINSSRRQPANITPPFFFSYRANLSLPVSSNLTFVNPCQLSSIPSSNLQTFRIPFLH